ncbi:DUF1345 domain-containing protein [Devosia sp.]|uniref:DUF1345 domain-containing protein n=1 Tax=Devosia sp. TaxID=1871048 RepID=UPI0025C301EB|nr:DUF1345 domain-containing protein [Devosia sp.]
MAGRRRIAALYGRLPRHFAFYAGVVAGAIAGLALALVAPAYAIALGANVMFAVYLGLVAIELPALTAQFLMQRPDDADSPVAAIFGVTVVVVIVAVGSLFLTLNDGGAADWLEISVSVVSVLLGWFTVHTMAALHYAHEYYLDAKAGSPEAIMGGLAFPGHERPDGYAFLYFSYVIGMTAQVADVAITSGAMRRRVTLHGVFSFLFNTVIVAATVNVVVTVAGG